MKKVLLLVCVMFLFGCNEELKKCNNERTDLKTQVSSLSDKVVALKKANAKLNERILFMSLKETNDCPDFKCPECMICEPRKACKSKIKTKVIDADKQCKDDLDKCSAKNDKMAPALLQCLLHDAIVTHQLKNCSSKLDLCKKVFTSRPEILPLD